MLLESVVEWVCPFLEWRQCSLLRMTPHLQLIIHSWQRTCDYRCAIGELTTAVQEEEWDDGLSAACASGVRGLVEVFIDRASDFNRGLEVACSRGDRKLAKLMISKGATYLRDGLAAACEGNHMKLADWLIQRGAWSCYYCGWQLSTGEDHPAEYLSD